MQRLFDCGWRVELLPSSPMFTGIISHQATVSALHSQEGGAVLTLHAPVIAADASIGDSIACAGVCLTVTAKTDTHFTVYAAPETFQRTTFASVKAGDVLNVEESLKVGDKVGGHFVFGHVDALGVVESIVTEGETFRLTVALPQNLMRFVAEKGSITLNGVSLTVTNVTHTHFTVMIIPHTWENTTLHSLKPKAQINVEIDMLARYVARLQDAA
jgi:riboflavin synthase